MKVFKVIFFSVLLFGCKYTQQTKQYKIIETSIKNVISNPKKYNNRTIKIYGYVVIGFEKNSVYSDKNEYSKLMSKNAIYLELPKNSRIKKISEGYMQVIGYYKKDYLGHMNMYGGTLFVKELIKKTN